MIPLRVCLEGFLCYLDAQEFFFNGARLWLLTGPNGSGKSALFDAITYALFHHHRGGSQNAEELIHKQCDRLRVEFDFLLDGRTYRVIRTLRRRAGGGTTASQEVRLREENDAGEPRWTTVPNTTQRRQFDAWVREHLGLTYETFTSSVLLLQNKAEKLLDAQPQGRFEVLAGIVDLQRYERLHERAREHCRQWENQVEQLRGRLSQLPEIPPLEIESVAQAIQEAEVACQQANAELERLEKMLAQAQRWSDLERERRRIQQQLREAQDLLREADALECAWQRYQELKALLPLVESFLQQRQCLQETQREVQRLQNQLQQLAEQVHQAQHDCEATQKQCNQLEKSLEEDHQQERILNEKLRTLAVQLSQLKEYEQQQTLYHTLRQQLTGLPADLEQQLQALQREREHLQKLRQEVLPALKHVGELWHHWTQASAQEQAALQAQQELESQLREQTAQESRLRQEVEAGQQRLQQLQEEAAAARTRWQDAQKLLQEVEKLRGAVTCRACGQPLTPEHLAAEQQRRQQQATDAETAWRTCDAARQLAEQQLRALRQRAELQTQHLLKLRQQLQVQQHQADKAREHKQHLRKQWNALWERLPADWQHRLPADLERVTPALLPDDTEQQTLQQQTDRLPVVERLWEETKQKRQCQRELQAQEELVRQQLQRLEKELPPEPAQLQQQHAELTSKGQALQAQLAASQKTWQRLRKELEEKQRQQQRLLRQQAQWQTELQEKEKQQRQYQQFADQALRRLPADWQPLAERAGLADWNNWKQEYENLVGEQIQIRYQKLETARQSWEGLRQRLRELETQQEEIPEEARREPQTVAGERDVVRRRWQECTRLYQERQHDLQRLQIQQQERHKLQAELRQMEVQYQHWRLLTELLGRERLQLYLVRQAERQIVAYANAVLDRLSGGEMALRLAGEAGGDAGNSKALQLEVYHRQLQDRPINIAFLSGSQRFRVAVSLALGIGQYANRQRRPLEAVIIDEGFGCLDRENRQVMIRELQNLSQYLRCILLVSHQEEFSEAFADGYHISLNGSTPQVRRFHR
jgi:exonuclease SbcC